MPEKLYTDDFSYRHLCDVKNNRLQGRTPVTDRAGALPVATVTILAHMSFCNSNNLCLYTRLKASSITVTSRFWVLAFVSMKYNYINAYLAVNFIRGCSEE